MRLLRKTANGKYPGPPRASIDLGTIDENEAHLADRAIRHRAAHVPAALEGGEAPYSEEKLESLATHIVVGKVQAIDSRTERDGNDGYVRKVAEVKVTQV